MRIFDPSKGVSCASVFEFTIVRNDDAAILQCESPPRPTAKRIFERGIASVRIEVAISAKMKRRRFERRFDPGRGCVRSPDVFTRRIEIYVIGARCFRSEPHAAAQTVSERGLLVVEVEIERITSPFHFVGANLKVVFAPRHLMSPSFREGPVMRFAQFMDGYVHR